jgi:hypothetical protein
MKKIGLEAKVNQYVLEWGLWSDKSDIDVWLEKFILICSLGRN